MCHDPDATVEQTLRTEESESVHSVHSTHVTLSTLSATAPNAARDEFASLQTHMRTHDARQGENGARQGVAEM